MLNVNIAYVAKLRIERFHFNRDFLGSVFPVFGENKKIYSTHLSIHSENEKKRSRKNFLFVQTFKN